MCFLKKIIFICKIFPKIKSLIKNFYYITATNDIGQYSRYPHNVDSNIMFVYGDLEDVIFEDIDEFQATEELDTQTLTRISKY